MNAVTGAPLIGSVPLPDAETVFRSVARELGPYLARIPDGNGGLGLVTYCPTMSSAAITDAAC